MGICDDTRAQIVFLLSLQLLLLLASISFAAESTSTNDGDDEFDRQFVAINARRRRGGNNAASPTLEQALAGVGLLDQGRAERIGKMLNHSSLNSGMLEAEGRKELNSRLQQQQKHQSKHTHNHVNNDHKQLPAHEQRNKGTASSTLHLRTTLLIIAGAASMASFFATPNKFHRFGGVVVGR